MIRLHHFQVPSAWERFLRPRPAKGRHRVTVHFQKHPAFDGLTLHPESLPRPCRSNPPNTTQTHRFPVFDNERVG